MRQRVPTRAWYSSGRAGRRPRVLVEDDHLALAISDFSLLQDAGFDVAYCSGPGHTPRDCPILRGQQCDVLAGADAVLHGLDSGLGIAAAIGRRHPRIAVVAEQHPRVDGSPEAVAGGCTPLISSCSVHGHIDALRASPLPARRTQRSGARSRRRGRGRAGAGTSRSSRHARRSGRAADAPTPNPGAGIPRSRPVSAATPGRPWSGVGRLVPTCWPFASAVHTPGSPVPPGRTSSDRVVVGPAARGER
jgi:hypothetical protein